MPEFDSYFRKVIVQTCRYEWGCDVAGLEGDLWKVQREVNVLDQACGGGDGEKRMCLEVEPTGSADAEGEGGRNLRWLQVFA